LSTWTTAELRLLRQHYPLGGGAACVPLIPRHTPGAIQRRARVIDLRAPRRGLSRGRKRVLNTTQTVALIKALRRGLKYGDIARLSRRLGMPPWAIKHALSRLAGETVTTGDRHWSAAADRLLIERADWPIERLAARLTAVGEPHSLYAIERRSRKLGAARDEAETCTASDLSRRLGLPVDTVSRWIRAGRLQAQRRVTYRPRARSDKPGNWAIRGEAVRDLMRAEPGLLAQLLPSMSPAGRLWLADLLDGLPPAEVMKQAPNGRATRGLPAHWMEAA